MHNLRAHKWAPSGFLARERMFQSSFLDAWDVGEGDSMYVQNDLKRVSHPHCYTLRHLILYPQFAALKTVSWLPEM